MKEKNEPGRIEYPVVLFDGLCNVCEGSVKFILKRDGNRRFRFASLQSDVAKDLTRPFGVDPSALNTMMLVQDGTLYKRSDAVLRIARRLRFPWMLSSVFLVLPRFLRDPVYNFVGRNRYRWFGKKDECMIPTPEIRERFLV